MGLAIDGGAAIDGETALSLSVAEAVRGYRVVGYRCQGIGSTR